MHKTFKKLAIAALLVASTGAFAQTKLTLGHNAAVGNPKHEAAVKFAELVKEKSGGRYIVQVAPAAPLAKVFAEGDFQDYAWDIAPAVKDSDWSDAAWVD